MKWLIWTIGGVLAALWTGALALTALIVDWTGSALLRAGQAGASPAPLPADPPAWLAGWFDPASWDFAVQAIQQTLQGAVALLPALGAASGWLEALVWVFWALGMVVLLGLAAGSHWWVGRSAPVAAAAR